MNIQMISNNNNVHKPSSIRQTLGWQRLLILVLAAVFSYAGATKLMEVSAFTHVIARFDVLSLALVNPVAITLPVVEILLGLALLVPALQRAALLGVILCGTLFAAALFSAILRGIPVSCGCFGMAEKATFNSALWALLRDSVLLAAAISLYFKRVRA